MTEDVIDVYSGVEQEIFEIGAGLVDAVGKPIASKAGAVDRVLETPHDVVRGAVEGWGRRRTTKGLADRLEGTANFLGGCRRKAQEAWGFGVRVRMTANRIRDAADQTRKKREGQVGEVRAAVATTY